MDTYYGTVKGTAEYYDTGDIITIKYDPDDPNNSTTILYPDKEALIINTILSVGCVLIGVAFVITVTYAKNKNNEKENKPKEQTQYSRKDPSLRGYPVKLVIMAIIYNLLNGGAWIIALVGVMFVVLAVLAKGLEVFYIAGVISLLLYMFKGIVEPVRIINRFYKELGSEQFHRTVDNALETSKTHNSDYEKIIRALYETFPADEDL